ncbi:MAG TPA: helix-turn-helix domain-containing protein [Chryseolinea sp.]
MEASEKLTYVKYSPDAKLSPLVVCYYFFEGNFDKEKIVQSPPTGYAAITFNFLESYAVCSGLDTAFNDSPGAVVVGQQTKNYKLRLSGHIQQIGIVLKPTAIATLFSYSLKGLVDKRIALDLVIGETASELLFDRLKNETRTQYRLALLHSFLVEAANGCEQRINVADLAADIILKNKGTIAIEELLDELCVSRRYLERKFMDKVGLSPKQYCRIVRMAHISNIVAHQEEIDWQDLVYKGGFHDQNHFIKDFKALNTLSPSKYHQEHSELIRLLQAKKKS